MKTTAIAAALVLFAAPAFAQGYEGLFAAPDDAGGGSSSYISPSSNVDTGAYGSYMNTEENRANNKAELERRVAEKRAEREKARAAAQAEIKKRAMERDKVSAEKFKQNVDQMTKALDAAAAQKAAPAEMPAIGQPKEADTRPAWKKRMDGKTWR